MPEPKYTRYVLPKATRTSLNLPQRVQYPFVHVEKEMWKDLDVNCNFACSCVSEPYVMPDPPHSHPFDEFLYFIGSDTDNPENLGAVVEIALGEEWKKHTFERTTVLCFPAGLHHAPVYVKKVDRPFFFGHVMRSSSYTKEPEIKADAKPEFSYPDVFKIPAFSRTEYGTELLLRGKAQGFADAFIHFLTIKKPAVVEQPKETKGYNRFAVLMGGDPKKIPDFTAEAQLRLGKEGETHVADSTTVFHIPANMPAKPVVFRKVESPVCFLNIYVPPE